MSPLSLNSLTHTQGCIPPPASSAGLDPAVPAASWVPAGCIEGSGRKTSITCRSSSMFSKSAVMEVYNSKSMVKNSMTNPNQLETKVESITQYRTALLIFKSFIHLQYLLFHGHDHSGSAVSPRNILDKIPIHRKVPTSTGFI